MTMEEMMQEMKEMSQKMETMAEELANMEAEHNKPYLSFEDVKSLLGQDNRDVTVVLSREADKKGSTISRIHRYYGFSLGEDTSDDTKTYLIIEEDGLGESLSQKYKEEVSKFPFGSLAYKPRYSMVDSHFHFVFLQNPLCKSMYLPGHICRRFGDDRVMLCNFWEADKLGGEFRFVRNTSHVSKLEYLNYSDEKICIVTVGCDEYITFYSPEFAEVLKNGSMHTDVDPTTSLLDLLHAVKFAKSV